MRGFDTDTQKMLYLFKMDCGGFSCFFGQPEEKGVRDRRPSLRYGAVLA